MAGVRPATSGRAEAGPREARAVRAPAGQTSLLGALFGSGRVSSRKSTKTSPRRENCTQKAQSRCHSGANYHDECSPHCSERPRPSAPAGQICRHHSRRGPDRAPQAGTGRFCRPLGPPGRGRLGRRCLPPPGLVQAHADRPCDAYRRGARRAGRAGDRCGLGAAPAHGLPGRPGGRCSSRPGRTAGQRSFLRRRLR